MEHFQVAVELDPVNVASHFALGHALAGVQRKDEAKAALSGRSNSGGDLVPECGLCFKGLGSVSL